MESKHTTRLKKPPKFEEMSKEEIRNTLIKKREKSAIAQRIVENLLNPEVKKDIFLNYLRDINQSHLDDVAEERAIAQICGYPLCPNQLTSNNIPKQQYRISVKTNKVYDITIRKNFCSNKCYEAMMYIKRQMLTGPLWFREYEDIPEFHLMPDNVMPSMGQEIDLHIVEKIKLKQDFVTSINDFAKASFRDISSDSKCSTEHSSSDNDEHRDSQLCLITEEYKLSSEVNLSEEEKQLTSEKSPSQNDEVYENKPSYMHTVNKLEQTNEQSTKLHNSKKESTLIPSTKLNVAKNIKNALVMGEVAESPQSKISPIITNVMQQNRTLNHAEVRKALQNKNESLTTLIIHVEKCIAEWFTIDSMILLFGEAKVKEMVADKGDSIKEYLNNAANGLMYSSESYDQYQLLCRKLNLLELQDHRYDKVSNKETKPLPDYSIIKEEGKKIELKMKAFLSGECAVVQETKIKTKPQDQSNLTQLALVDKNAKNALRRKILLTNLNRVVQDLQSSLGLQSIPIISDIRHLVNSFKLKAHNIMFKPVQWTLIGVVLIKLLSLRDAKIQHTLELQKVHTNLQLLLLSYKQDGGYLERLILWLTDIDRLLDTTDTQLTVYNHIKQC